MFRKEETMSSTDESERGEVENNNVTSRQQSNRIVYDDLVTKVDSLLNALNKFTEPLTDSAIRIQDEDMIVEECEKAELSAAATDILSQHPFQTTSNSIEPEVICLETESSTCFFVDRKDSSRLRRWLQAPIFHRISSENPLHFLECPEDIAEFVYQSDNLTLLINVSKFLRDSTLDWYHQLRQSYRRPHTWEEFTDSKSTERTGMVCMHTTRK